MNVYNYRCTLRSARNTVLQLVGRPGIMNRDPTGCAASEADCANVELRRFREEASVCWIECDCDRTPSDRESLGRRRAVSKGDKGHPNKDAEAPTAGVKQW